MSSDKQRPWGRMSAILMGCYVTIIGLCFRLDPDVILVRSTLAAIATGFVIRTLIALLPVSKDA